MLLFSLCHFFTPWQNVGRARVLLPVVYAAFRRLAVRYQRGAENHPGFVQPGCAMIPLGYS